MSDFSGVGGKMADYTELNYNELVSIVDSHKAAFICGNGLSINFDEGYLARNLNKRLFETHCHLIDNIDYNVFSDEKYNAALKENFQRSFDALKQLKSFKDFECLYSSALIFAKSVICSEMALKWLDDNGYNQVLTFGLSTISLLKAIVTQADKYGIFNVNYEYLTIMIYFVIALKQAPKEIYCFDVTNLFVLTVSWGCKYSFSKQQGSGNALSNTAISGMFIYYRFLYSSNILMNGKSFDVKKLQNWNSVDRQSLNEFLHRFDYIITTNYDNILDTITNQRIYHLHGQFSVNKNIVLHQSLGVKYDSTRYDISTILIGDYFLSKSVLPISANLAAETGKNTKYDFYSKVLEKTIRDMRTEIVVIFGLNIENDYHILRELQVFLEAGGTIVPKIIYCYYTETDKNIFCDMYDKCITYSIELSELVRNKIDIYVVNSQDVLKHFM